MTKLEEKVTMEVEAPVVEKKKKSKKSKKADAVEVVEDEITTLKRKAQEEHEDAPKKKKSKKNKTEATEETKPVAMEVEEGEKKKKKKSKKNKETTAAEEPAVVVEEEKDESTADAAPTEKKDETADASSPTENNEDADNLTVFVGGLPWSAEEETVKKDFTECGEITRFAFLTDRETGRPKGSCFIDYANAEGVKKALEFNETEYGGRQIFVRMATAGGDSKGKGKKGGKKGKGKGVPGEKPDGCKSVIVKNMSYNTTEDSLWAMFESCGSIERLKLLTDRETGSSKGIAFVDFAEEGGCDEAIKKCNSDLDGRTIFVDYSGGKGEGKKGDGKKGDGKKGGKKGGKGKGKKGGKDNAISSANRGSIVESTGEKKTFDDSDSD